MPSKSFGSVKVFSPPFDLPTLLRLLDERTKELARKLPLRRVVLFGSWARGKATAFSDIDLLVIYADPPRDDAYRIVRQTINLQGLEAHVYTESEVRQIERTLQHMTEGGIMLLEISKSLRE
jgi:predicted nucleotidyltransferase